MGCQRPSLCEREIYHVKGSPVDQNVLYASQCSGWFGQMIQRSNDGKTWEPVVLVHLRYYRHLINGIGNLQHPWEFKRVWHLEPSLTDPEMVYAGVEDAAMFPRAANVVATVVGVGLGLLVLVALVTWIVTRR